MSRGLGDVYKRQGLVGPVLVLGQRHSRVLLFSLPRWDLLQELKWSRLLSEQKASDEGELPKELIQEVESEPVSFQEPAALSML